MVAALGGVAALTAVLTVVGVLVTGVVTVALPGLAGAASDARAVVRTSAPASIPVPSDVRHGRFVTSVALDAGAVTVVPAPAHDRPALTQARVAKEVWANPALMGDSEGPLGFGLVTVSARADGVPRITRLPAWVGFAKSSGHANCPAQLVPAPGTTSTPTTSTPTADVAPSPQDAPSNGWAAVVIGAATGAPAVTYTARAVLCESLRPDSLTPASEVVSVPWQALGAVENDVIRVQATLPACGVFQGISSGGSDQVTTITITAVVPDVHGRCSGTRRTTQSVDLGPIGNPPGAPPPVVSPTTTIRHGRLGLSVLTVAVGS